MARGRFVTFLDDDDLLERGSLARQVDEADRNVADVLICRWRVANLGDTEGGVQESGWSNRGVDSLLAGEAAPTGAVLYRRSYLDAHMWDEQMSKIDDWDFFVRAALRGGVIRASQIISYTWMSHPGQGVHRASMLDNAREFYTVLDRLAGHLEGQSLLTPPRKRRLAQYLYKELRVLARFDRSAFEQRARQILQLDPRFSPVDEERSAIIRWLCRAIGLKAALRLYAIGRRNEVAR